MARKRSTKLRGIALAWALIRVPGGGWWMPSHVTSAHSVSASQITPSKSRMSTGAPSHSAAPSRGAGSDGDRLGALGGLRGELLGRVEHGPHELADVAVVGAGDDVAVHHHIALDHGGARVGHVVAQADVGAHGVTAQHARADHDPRSVAESCDYLPGLVHPGHEVEHPVVGVDHVVVLEAGTGDDHRTVRHGIASLV